MVLSVAASVEGSVGAGKFSIDDAEVEVSSTVLDA